MDLNQLLYHHQIALIHASKHGAADDGSSHFDMVKYYAKRIRAYRNKRGLSEYAGGGLNDGPSLWTG